jgi:heme exporter protein CcmD
MMDAPHFGFVIAAYAIATLVVAAMVASIVWDYRLQSAALSKLENERGGSREA